jgi:hypothetical protein
LAVRFYFDIHYGGNVQIDDEGEEFGTIEEARAYVLSTINEFQRLDPQLSCEVIRYGRIEIRNRGGTSLDLPISAIRSMTMTRVDPLGTSGQTQTGFVEWGLVLAGAALAAALSFVFLTFGTAIGLSATSPWPGSGISAKVLASLAVFWAMVQQIGVFMIGGYVAGRMRAKGHDVSRDEVEFRDGLHGGLVWAVGIIIGAAMLMAAAGGAVRTGADIAGTAAVSAASANPMDETVDALLRPMTAASARGWSEPDRHHASRQP